MLVVPRANSQVDHLEPTESYFSSWSFMDVYHSKCRSILFNDLQKYFVIRVVVLPSFQKEYLLTIEKRNNSNSLVLREPSVKISNAPNNTTIRTVDKVIWIDSILSNSLKLVFKKMIFESNYIKVTNECEADGIEYQFITFEKGIGQMAARTWSCAESKRLKTLMEIVALLRSSCLNNSLKTHRKTILDKCRILQAA